MSKPNVFNPTPDEIATILANHAKWLRGQEGAVYANLMGANLMGANLMGANLRRANLMGANLMGANLRDANLMGANLMGANLMGANLRDANLIGANLMGAKLRDANLIGANLMDANLRRARLGGAGLGDKPSEIWLPTGETLEQYRNDVIPALVAAGGKMTLEQLVASGAWDCNTWDNCPMHAAFCINGPEEAPPLLRPRVEQFVQLYDAGWLPKPAVAAAPAEPKPE